MTDVNVYLAHQDYTVTTTVEEAVDGLKHMLEQGWDSETEAHLTMAIAALSGTREAVEPVAWQNRVRYRNRPESPWLPWQEWREGKANVNFMVGDHAEYEERPLYAAPPSDPVGQGAVTVKTLEWVKHSTAEMWRCDTALGLYQVAAVVKPASWTFDGLPGVTAGGKTSGPDEAKAACQADFERRILSALSPAPEAGSDEAERLRDQLGEMREALDGIYIYANDTLSGRVDGPDDRTWQRTAVVEIRNRARVFATVQSAVDARRALAETQEAGR